MTNKDGDILRQEAWIRAWCAVATANDCKEAKIAALWANACLAAFDKAFPPKENKETDE